MTKSQVIRALACVFVASAATAAAQDAEMLADTDIAVIRRVEPRWPQHALIQNISGYVVLEGIVGSDGLASGIRVVDSAPKGVFDVAAMSALKRWVFSPRIENGVAVPRQFRQAFKFNLVHGDPPMNPLIAYAERNPEEARALYREVRARCPDVYPRASDAVNEALRVSSKFTDASRDPQSNPLHVSYDLLAVERCLFSSWEQLGDVATYLLAARFNEAASWEAGRDPVSAALEAYAARFGKDHGAAAAAPQQMLAARTWVFRRIAPAYRELVHAQAKAYPPAAETEKSTKDALDGAREAWSAGRVKEARSILVKALKQTTAPVDRILLTLALASAESANGNVEEALASLERATGVEGAPWNVVQSARIARATLCGPAGRIECFDRSLRELNADLGVADKLDF
jgi:TonB family protein